MPMTDDGRRPTLCIGVLTLNEERRIEGCLRSAAFADQIVVVDSGSTDRTRDIAQSLGAEVYVYDQWEGFATQRNRLLAHVKTDYIFFLDADEEITPALQAEIQAAIKSPTPKVWETYWQEVAFGKPIVNLMGKKSLARLFPKSYLLRFEGVVHEHAVLLNDALPRQTFKSALLHYSRETVHDSLRKLTQYSMLGAAKRAEKGKTGGVLRGLASALPMFFRLYVLRGSFLSGGPGFLYAFFIALECFFRYAALRYDKNRLSNTVRR